MTCLQMSTAGLLRIVACISLLSLTFASRHQSSLPNIVLLLTDDLDLTLGGPSALPKTRRLIASQGADLPQWFVHTPICCPSRAEILTGKYFHNLKISSPSRDACMYVNVTDDVNCRFYKEDYFARHFNSLGYSVGVFGKHLNRFNTRDPPQGVERWFVNGGGSYLNPVFTSAYAGEEPEDVHFNNCTDADGKHIDCYSTSIIGNTSLSWIRDQSSAEHSFDKANSFFAYVSVKAPHIQDGPGFPMSVPAPWYNNTPIYGRQRAPRTPNYNASCPSHHWLVRQQTPLTDLQSSKVDDLYVSRLRTLLSVDDLVEELIKTLDGLGVLQNTYIMFTSDNGYRLGQYRMPQGKFHTYENDIRVPMYLRGPGIRPGSVRSDIIGIHPDIMPTLLGLSLSTRTNDDADTSTLKESLKKMDGENLAPLLLDNKSSNEGSQRNLVLVEYIGLGDVVRYQHLEDCHNNTFRTLRLIDLELPDGWQNIKYVEFTDCVEDWNFEQEPKELEFFNLASDPFEMKNIISDVPNDMLQELRKLMRQLYTCAGDSCRGVSFPSSFFKPKQVATA